MLTVKTAELELTQVWWDSDPEHNRVRFTFPIHRETGARDSAVVYFELEPGERLQTHTDSEEEILYIVSGEVEAHVGDELGRLSAGDLALIPAMAPHGAVNVGDETVRVVGFFAGSVVESAFEEPIQPLGITEVTSGAPAPIPA
jgi:quercetin dioxygenase-like cupin family protein